MRTPAQSNSRSVLLSSPDRRYRAARWLCLTATLLILPFPALGVASGIDTETDAHTPEKAVSDSAGDAAVKLDPVAGAAAISDLTLLLEVELNGNSTGKIGEFILRRGRLMARASELRDLGFQVPEALAFRPTNLVALSDLPGVTFTIDEVNQVLHVTVALSGLQPTILQPAARESAEGHRVIESGTGVTVNYDVVDTVASGQTSATGAFDSRVFSPLGIVSSGWLSYAGSDSSASGSNHAVRLDSAYTYADVNTLRRYSLGDFITGGLSWTRPVRLEGFQIRSDFSMRPDLITFPMPSVKGTAAVRSSVNVLADGNLVASGEITPGAFEVPQLPVMSGAGTISLSMTNALGQQVVVTQPFYASSALLAPGLQTFAVQAGPVRRKWGSVSNDYGKVAGIGSYRRGLSPKFTIEGSAEGTPGTFVGGAGGVTQIGTLGVLNFSAAGSFGPGGSGGQISAGTQRIGRLFSLGASATMASRKYWDIASFNGDGVVRRQVSAFTSLSFRRFGSTGLAYAGVNQDASPHPLTPGTVAQSSHVLSGSYSLQFHRMAFYASLFKSFDQAASTGAQFGVTIPFGRRSSADVSVSSDGYAQFEVQQPATQVGEWGYQAYVAAGSANHQFGQVAYKSARALLSAGMDNSAGVATLRMESAGALSFVDRGLFLSNLIYDSFAIVDTNPLRRVHVLQENRDVGRTGASGRLLVPDMRSFQLNHVTIDPTDLPADVLLRDAAREVRPQDRSGVVVKFGMKISHGALLHLVDESGNVLPLGSSAKLLATGVVVPVGYDGEAYIEDLSPHNELVVERPDGRRCRAIFEYRATPGEIPSIGPVPCTEPKP